jgi:predicted ArsR family transcriptional regulator
MEPHTVRAGLVDLLGEPRATIVRALKRDGERTASELAELLGVTDVAVRRHLGVLADEGLITNRTVKQERGRPVSRYRLSARGEELFPHRYEEMVAELIGFISEQQGQNGLRAFLRWRQDRETEAYAQLVDGDDVPERLDQLAAALRDAGFEADVRETEDGFELTQTHCAVMEVAKEHPELCAHEAAMFRRVLGDVRISRRETLATGADACVCAVVSCADDVSQAEGTL